MKTHTTNYKDTFIKVAEDCPVEKGTPPPEREGKKTIANLQFEKLKNNPYQYTSDDILFRVFAERKDLSEAALASERQIFFSKGQACFRASPLTKKYGWGVHSDSNGKIALYGVETEAYEEFTKRKDLDIVKAMRTTRK